MRIFKNNGNTSAKVNAGNSSANNLKNGTNKLGIALGDMARKIIGAVGNKVIPNNQKQASGASDQSQRTISTLSSDLGSVSSARSVFNPREADDLLAAEFDGETKANQAPKKGELSKEVIKLERAVTRVDTKIEQLNLKLEFLNERLSTDDEEWKELKDAGIDIESIPVYQKAKQSLQKSMDKCKDNLNELKREKNHLSERYEDLKSVLKGEASGLKAGSDVK